MTLSPPYYNIQGPKANLFFENFEKFFMAKQRCKKTGCQAATLFSMSKKSGGLEKFPVQVYNRI